MQSPVLQEEDLSRIVYVDLGQRVIEMIPVEILEVDKSGPRGRMSRFHLV